MSLKKFHSFIFTQLCNKNLVWFYGISIIVGYLMPSPIYTCYINCKLAKAYLFA